MSELFISFPTSAVGATATGLAALRLLEGAPHDEAALRDVASLRGRVVIGDWHLSAAEAAMVLVTACRGGSYRVETVLAAELLLAHADCPNTVLVALARHVRAGGPVFDAELVRHPNADHRVWETLLRVIRNTESLSGVTDYPPLRQHPGCHAMLYALHWPRLGSDPGVRADAALGAAPERFGRMFAQALLERAPRDGSRMIRQLLSESSAQQRAAIPPGCYGPLFGHGESAVREGALLALGAA